MFALRLLINLPTVQTFHFLSFKSVEVILSLELEMIGTIGWVLGRLVGLGMANYPVSDATCWHVWDR